MLTGWTRAEIGGKPADVFDPGGPVRFALLYLHDQSGDIPAELTDHLGRLKLACVAPHAGRSWWVDRVCPEFDPELTAEQHLLRSVVPWMASRWPAGVAVAGVGMGGQGAVRLGLRHPDRFRVVASIGGAFDFHDVYGRGTPLDAMYATREQCRLDTAVLQVDPSHWPSHVWFACDPADPWHRGNDRLDEKLTAYGVPHTADLDTSTGGDARAYLDRMAGPMLEFVVNSLASESRRLM